VILRLLVRCFTRLHRFRAFNTAVLRTPGPVILIPNHVSWIDFLFLGLVLDDDWKFVTSLETAQTSWFHRKIMVSKRTFPVDPASPFAVRQMAEFLNKGGRLVLFAEGRLSRTGTLMKFFDGSGFLLNKTRAQVIIAYLRGIQRSVFAVHPGHKRRLPRVTLHCSPLLTPPARQFERSAEAREFYTAWLFDRATDLRFAVEMEQGAGTLPDAIRAAAAEQPDKIIIEDLTGRKTYRELLTGAEIFTRLLHRRLDASPHVGVLLPNSTGMVVTLLALWALGRVPGILNFSTGSTAMLACTTLAQFTCIITSRRFLERSQLDLAPLTAAGITFLYLEDLRAAAGPADKLAAWLRARSGLLFRPRDAAGTAERTAVILFTSGSEGTPKGVRLSHRNLLANVRQILSVVDITDNDRIFSSLPMFHSFGLTIGTMLPLLRGLFVFVYPTPLHYRLIPILVYDRDCTIMLATNTFLNGYARRAHPYDFRSVRFMFAAAEKLQEATATTWSRKFGLRVLEGYGATECSPAVSVNTAIFPQFGSAGKLLPGIAYRLEPVPGVTDGGRLFVRGPNIMQGYLNPEPDAAFRQLDGWYDTGDIVSVDDLRFVTIRGRVKRFAKVSGEMVSLTAVEDALAGAFPQHGRMCEVVVITRPDEKKGETLIAVTNAPALTLAEIREAVLARGLTVLAVPRELRVVDRIPKLGTGKADYRTLETQLRG